MHCSVLNALRKITVELAFENLKFHLYLAPDAAHKTAVEFFRSQLAAEFLLQIIGF